MSKEIERKFLVDINKLLPFVVPTTEQRIIQAYLSTNIDTVVRVRTVKCSSGLFAYLTVKGKTVGVTRTEFEYQIPFHDAVTMLEMCDTVIDKNRYQIGKWEVDFFFGPNDGLIVAEIELDSADEEFELPEWATEEVSYDPRYYNSNLIKNPYISW